ncbi:aminoimidazole riboside kinase [Vibrio genomosp. F10 str. ZF-129]|uniref:Aminoimidazole riboside kinase n=1 Tax=Vibrio genomosp. F10 str. ZF-129 TaxID=1187848 RepID=A0A1E5BIW5_9VIBR|nr:aminoimidazole riboside kinase [Vibrio genomosp. F10]OEE37343.1 aminoimidazole riboside kinase [Vibrio genomosp. F10 str. ZF-129]
MAKVWVTGDAVVDLIPDGDNTYLKCPGGAPANVAVGIARLGGNAAFIGRVGCDPLGKFMKQVLTNERVDTQSMLLDEKHRTSTVLVDLDDDGERSFTFMVLPSADQFLEPSDIPSFNRGEWLHVCSIALANEPSRSTTLNAMKAIKSAGGYVSFDPNLRDDVWTNRHEMKPVVLDAIALADVAKFSDDELFYLTEKSDTESAIDWLKHHYTIPLTIITQGKDGAIIISDNTRQWVKGQPLVPIDTTGAGDAFVGGLLAGLSSTEDWQQWDNLVTIITQANACGALATTAKGAMTALPTETQLHEYLKSPSL